MKDIIGRILILTSLLGLCIVFLFTYFHNAKVDADATRAIQELLEGIREADDAFTRQDLSSLLSLPAGSEEAVPSDRIFTGTSFFEIHEIDLFFIKKLQDADEIPELYPPLELTCSHVEEGISLKWSHNPENDALIEKSADNPLLMLKYKIYRWTSDQKHEPEVIATLPYRRDQLIDKDVSAVGHQYYYCVLSAFVGRVRQHKTLIESERSEVRSIVYKDRFKLNLMGGDASKVFIKVSIQKYGIMRSHVFQMQVGDVIGHEIDISGVGKVDFNTDLKLTAILPREEEREVTVQRPVFNADGSRSLDPVTQEPIFHERQELQNNVVLSIECEDIFGTRRVVEEN